MSRVPVEKEPLHCWRFRPSQIAAPPSVADGIAPRIEQQLRRDGCAQIISMAERILTPERMRAPATTAIILFQRFFMRQSFKTHDRHIVAVAALFLACKVEEQHRRVRHFVDAAYCLAHGVDAPPESSRDETSSDWCRRRDALLEAERVLLQTLEFDFAVEQPATVITSALRRWRDAGQFGSRFERVPELAALDRAAASIAFVCMATDLPLLFTTREVGIGSLWLAYAGAPVTVAQRLKLSDASFTPLMEARMLAAFSERAHAAFASLASAEAAVREGLPLAFAFASGAPPEAFLKPLLKALSAPAAPAPGAPLVSRGTDAASGSSSLFSPSAAAAAAAAAAVGAAGGAGPGSFAGGIGLRFGSVLASPPAAAGAAAAAGSASFGSAGPVRSPDAATHASALPMAEDFR